MIYNINQIFSLFFELFKKDIIMRIVHHDAVGVCRDYSVVYNCLVMGQVILCSGEILLFYIFVF